MFVILTSMPEHDELLERTYALAKANNKMLRRMRRNAFIGGILKLLFWAVLLGVPIWLYFQFLQPVLAELMGTIDQLQQTGSQLQQIGSGATNQFNELQGFFNNLPGFGE